MTASSQMPSGISDLLSLLSSPQFDDRLLRLVRPYLQSGRRTLVSTLPLARHIGHLGPEPHYLKTMFGSSYEQIVLITPPRSDAGINQGLFDLLATQFTMVETDDKLVLYSSLLNQGLSQKDPFDFYAAHILRFYRDYGIARWTQGSSFLSMDGALQERGWQWLNRLGIETGRPFILLHVRDTKHVSNPVNRHEGMMRAASLENFLPAVEWLSQQGFPVFRIGGRDDPALTLKNDLIFDLPRLDGHEDWMDVFLCGQCFLSINCQSGPEGLVRAFGRPSLTTNLLPTVFGHHLPGDLFLYKPLMENGKTTSLTYSEILERNLPLFLNATPLPNAQFYQEAGITPAENSARAIRMAAMEMIKRLEHGAEIPLSGGKERFLAQSMSYQARLNDNESAKSRGLDLFTHALGWGSLADAQLDQVLDFV